MILSRQPQRATKQILSETAGVASLLSEFRSLSGREFAHNDPSDVWWLEQKVADFSESEEGRRPARRFLYDLLTEVVEPPPSDWARSSPDVQPRPPTPTLCGFRS